MVWSRPKRAARPKPPPVGPIKTPTQLKQEADARSKTMLATEPWKAWTKGRLLWAKTDLKLDTGIGLGLDRVDWLVPVEPRERNRPNLVIVVPAGWQAIYLGEHLRIKRKFAEPRVIHHFLTPAGRYFADPVLFRDEDEENDPQKG
jgi:hypothetical protein